ncbi:NUDIX hydrolase [Maribacter arenosus]|uniref:NUDIX hydrolase n=1 Tax=Maribacter arenosus TaxID=1854708 RepID=A0ABR7VDZ6_9FLAO|nr:NUDIX hydrolase [Maribacter arenosus]MBD0850367.1 NUDIX hydrolase [Maribacter arenosus]
MEKEFLTRGLEDEIQDLREMEDAIENWHPGSSVDCVILGYEKQKVKVLLLKMEFDDLRMLPGGMIPKNKDLRDAAYHVLKVRTGLESVFLKQFHTFGRKDRPSIMDNSFSEKGRQYLDHVKLNYPKYYDWMNRRYITTGYFALVDISKVKVEYSSGQMNEKYDWVAIDNIPDLIMDHDRIIRKCLDFIRVQLNYLPISMNLLPDEFTMKDLQKLYEAFLNEKLERSNFQRKMLKLGIFDRLKKKMSGAANKAPYLYRFDKDKYNELVKKGIGVL